MAAVQDGRVVHAYALQLEARFGDVAANRDRLADAIRGLPDPVDLVVAPELVTTGYDVDRLLADGPDLAEPLDGPSVTLVAELAREREATVVFGLLERDDQGRLADTAVVVTPGGSVTPYRKTHLYPPERQLFAPGDRLLTVDTGAGRLGPLICFEHAFPELATTLALDGAEIFTIPSAVPVGYEHVLTLRSRARAQDNQVFVVAANLAGGGFCGRSLITDPRGEVLAAAGSDEAVLGAALDLDAIGAERKREPSLRLRRPKLYRDPGAR
ncbi:MAG: carbon-nitrogen hydrolase family protein [Nitriliruptorales bacterium]